MKHGDLFFHRLTNLPNFILKHPTANHLKRVFSQITNLMVRLDSPDLQESRSNSWDQDLADVFSLIQEGLYLGFFNKTKNISDLLSLIEHDLLVVLRSLLADTKKKYRGNAFFNTNLTVDQGPALNRDVFKQLDIGIKIRSRDSYASFSIINCLKDPAELAEASRITSTFLASVKKQSFIESCLMSSFSSPDF